MGFWDLVGGEDYGGKGGVYWREQKIYTLAIGPKTANSFPLLSQSNRVMFFSPASLVPDQAIVNLTPRVGFQLVVVKPAFA
jgi:hypothetical protein